MAVRKAEVFGDIHLSVQASDYHYCSPRVQDLPLEEYKSVEIALFKNGKWTRPKELGLPEFDSLFEENDFPIASYVPQETLNRLRDALRKIQ